MAFFGSDQIDALLAAVEQMPEPPPASPIEKRAWSPDELNALLLAESPSESNTPDISPAPSNAGAIGACPECLIELGLPAPSTGQATESWRCLGCGAVCLTGPTSDRHRNHARAQRRAESDGGLPIAAMAASQRNGRDRLLRLLTGSSYTGDERRGYPRAPLSLPAVAVFLNEDRSASGFAFRVTTRDVSACGMSVFCESGVTSPMLLIDFTRAGLPGWQIVIRVTRSRPAGFLYEVGGDFVFE